MEISVCMIVKNEENILGRCLESVSKFADEIILIDTGSTDKTKFIGEKFKAKIYDFEWCDDFAKARNYSFSKATKEYIFWLDADDYITEKNIEKILNLKSTLSKNINGVSMDYSLTRDEFGKTTYSLRRNRLIKRSLGFKWIGRIHEYLEIFGDIIYSDIEICHDKDKPHTNRNLKVFKSMEKNKEKFTDRDRFYFANELYYNGEYKQAIENYKKFIADGRGWIEDLKTATANIIECNNALNRSEENINAILESYRWGSPRADICCKMGEYFINKNDYTGAIFWYKAAMLAIPEKGYMGIDRKEYYTWIPSIQLCVCYSNLDEYEKAYYYNEMTANYVGETSKVIHNRNFLIGKLKEQKVEIPKYKNILIKEI